MKQHSRSQSRTQSQSQPRGTTPKPVRVEQVLDQVESGVTQLDAERAAGYASLLTLRSAKETALARREKLYALKYGEKDAHVLRARRQREVNTQLQQEVALAQVDAAVPTPDVEKDGYVLHGFVRNRARQPQPKLTVAVYDQKGALVRQLGYACTDEKGYFLLRYQKPPQSEKPAAPNEPATGPQRPKAAESAPTKSEKAELKTQQQIVQEAAEKESPRHEPGRSAPLRSFEIRVHRDQQLVHREAQPIQPRPGQIDYREIIIGDDDCGCTPPPATSESGKPVKPSAKTPAPPAAKISAKSGPNPAKKDRGARKR